MKEPIKILLLLILLISADTAVMGHPSFAETVKERSIIQFWQQTRLALDQVPIQAKVIARTEALPYHTFKIILQGLNKVKFVALLAIPIQGETKRNHPWPVVITTPGFGGQQQGVMLSECQRGYAVLQVFPRGQGESAEFYKINGNKLTGNLVQPDSAYYRGAYADVMRAIDYIYTRKDLDSNRIALVGTSQGGGISLAVASLDSRVKTVVAHLPFLCNINLAAKTEGSLVKQLLDQAKQNNRSARETLAYFDPYQLVSGLRAPTLISGGGMDKVCPFDTIKSVYDQIKGKKELKFYPDLQHTSCLDFYQQMWRWLEKYL
ncbi:MAG: acetylxylan esterase [Pedobacter sp.]|nr:acetylxylan esterase [Pedobacter sp.]MDQ8052195.1 acetylxylan esterase [Pedobacter sp.]